MQPTGSFPYIGNPDFRGYLYYQSKNSPIDAGNYEAALNLSNNDGQLSDPNASDTSGMPLQGWVNQQYQNWYNTAYPKQQAAATGDPNTAAYYDDIGNQLQGQLGQLDPQQGIGLQNIANSYNLSGNRLREGQAVAQRNYDTSRNQNIQGYANNRSAITNNTASTNAALQRLLGINGSGYSSAAFEQAPYAAALQGTQQLGQAQQTYGNNQSALDTNWQDTQRGYSNAFSDLDRQKYQQENALRSSIAQTRASLLDKIAQASTNSGLARGENYAQAAAGRAPYQQQIDSLLSQITQLGSQYANPVLQEQNVSYAAPDLGQYTLGRQAAPTTGGAQGTVDPTFLSLLTQDRDRYGNLIVQ